MKRSTPRKAPAAAPANPAARDQIILLLVSGIPEDTIREAALTKLNVAARNLDALIEECKHRITLAARFDRADELGKAITRLHDCYARCNQIQDFKTCVQVQREINKLLGLYASPVEGDPGDRGPAGEAAGEPPAEAEARAHLAPLFDDGPSLPLPELARLAAARIISQ